MGRDDSGNRLCYRGCHVSSLVKMGEPIQCFDMQTRTKARRPVWLNISVLATSNDHGEPLTIHLFRDRDQGAVEPGPGTTGDPGRPGASQRADPPRAGNLALDGWW
jgi:hypothetical protein